MQIDHIASLIRDASRRAAIFMHLHEYGTIAAQKSTADFTRLSGRICIAKFRVLNLRPNGGDTTTAPLSRMPETMHGLFH